MSAQIDTQRSEMYLQSLEKLAKLIRYRLHYFVEFSRFLLGHVRSKPPSAVNAALLYIASYPLTNEALAEYLPRHIQLVA